jgi:hypothetical protein
MVRESFFSVKEIFRDKRKLTVFLICLALSLFSWILISLGKEYSTTYVVPVKYTNFPENKTLLNDVPDQIAVSVMGSGFELLQFDERLTEDTLLVNLDNLKTGMYGAYERGYLDQSVIGKDIQERLRGALALNRVLTDSVVFVFDLKVARTLAVKPRASFQVKQGFVQVDSITAIPAEVEVMGALSVLDTMHYIRTELVELGELSKSRKQRVALSHRFIGMDAATSVDSVQVVVSIDQLTERSFMVTPDLLNVPDSLEMLIFPNSVEVTVQLPLSKYDDVNVDDIELTVDFNDLEEGYMVLPVHMEKWPVLAERVQVKPDQVEIVLTRVE